MRGFLPLSRALTLGFQRDRAAMFFTILFPLIFLIIIGGLFSGDGVPQSRVIVVGEVDVLDALPPEARTEVDRVLTITRSDDLAESLQSVREGDHAAVIEQRGTEVRLHYSAADQVAAGIVRSVLASLVQETNLAMTGQPAHYALVVTGVEDASLKQIQYLTPGILGWAIATGATFGAASTLLLWRRGGLLRRLRLSPASSSAIISARILVSLGVALAQTVLFLAVGALFFGLRLSGAWWMSLPLVLAGTLAFMSIGLLAGALSKSVETANAVSNLIIIPMAFLSGSFFPLEMAPEWLQTLSVAFPLRHLNVGMLDVIARGASPVDVLPEIGVLLAFAAVVTAIAARFLRWDDA